MLHHGSKPSRFAGTVLAALVLPAVLAGCFHGNGDGPSTYSMTAGSAAGVYFAISNGIAAAVNNATDVNFRIEVSTSQGSVQNAERLRSDTHQLAVMQNDVAFYAAKGQGAFSGKAVGELRALASLYPEMIQIVVLKSSNINSISDLAGKKVVLGAGGSGAAVNAGDILNASGVQVQREFMDLTTGADRLKDGGVDAVFWTGGVPTGAITSLATTHPVRILPVTDAIKDTLRASLPFYANATLPAGTYEGQDTAVQTVAVMAVLVARSDMPAEDAQKLLQIVFESGKVQQAHAQGANVKLDNAFLGLTGVPWHDGATAYYTSKGQTVPAS